MHIHSAQLVTQCKTWQGKVQMGTGTVQSMAQAQCGLINASHPILLSLVLEAVIVAAATVLH